MHESLQKYNLRRVCNVYLSKVVGCYLECYRSDWSDHNFMSTPLKWRVTIMPLRLIIHQKVIQYFLNTIFTPSTNLINILFFEQGSHIQCEELLSFTTFVRNEV